MSKIPIIGDLLSPPKPPQPSRRERRAARAAAAAPTPITPPPASIVQAPPPTPIARTIEPTAAQPIASSEPAAVTQARTDTRQSELSRRGRRASILTSSQGELGDPLTKRPAAARLGG